MLPIGVHGRASVSEGNEMRRQDQHAKPPPLVITPPAPRPAPRRPHDPKHPEAIPPKHDLPK